ncbi:hypothetical protein G7Y89_g3371 [Cudoniella acicularis]|uniref:Carrier domain-containing protein n=1 Tax=Cudoniella acicularis TaxID=354080 RepID=A0A8H4RRI6_9HELO|nr:hypothetical protein G7Y89_g3371 [Cudoniella acicularis]
MSFLRGRPKRASSQSQSSIVAANPSNENTKKRLGLVLINEGHEPLVDLVAIPNLSGHPIHTWTADNGVMWLSDLLPLCLPRARILCWGHDKMGYLTKSVEGINDHAETLALIYSQSTPATQNIFRSTYGIIFMATAHQGITKQLSNWLKVYSFLLSGDEAKVMRDISNNSEFLQSQNENFSKIAGNIQFVSAYEVLKTTVGLSSFIIVPKSSAIVPGLASEPIAINAIHTQVSKFASQDDPNFIRVSESLMLMFQRLTYPHETSWANLDEGVTRSGLPTNIPSAYDQLMISAQEWDPSLTTPESERNASLGESQDQTQNGQTYKDFGDQGKVIINTTHNYYNNSYQLEGKAAESISQTQGSELDLNGEQSLTRRDQENDNLQVSGSSQNPGQGYIVADETSTHDQTSMASKLLTTSSTAMNLTNRGNTSLTTDLFGVTSTLPIKALEATSSTLDPKWTKASIGGVAIASLASLSISAVNANTARRVADINDRSATIADRSADAAEQNAIAAMSNAETAAMKLDFDMKESQKKDMNGGPIAQNASDATGDPGPSNSFPEQVVQTRTKTSSTSRPNPDRNALNTGSNINKVPPPALNTSKVFQENVRKQYELRQLQEQRRKEKEEKKSFIARNIAKFKDRRNRENTNGTEDDLSRRLKAQRDLHGESSEAKEGNNANSQPNRDNSRWKGKERDMGDEDSHSAGVLEVDAASPLGDFGINLNEGHSEDIDVRSQHSSKGRLKELKSGERLESITTPEGLQRIFPDSPTNSTPEPKIQEENPIPREKKNKPSPDSSSSISIRSPSHHSLPTGNGNDIPLEELQPKEKQSGESSDSVQGGGSDVDNAIDFVNGAGGDDSLISALTSQPGIMTKDVNSKDSLRLYIKLEKTLAVDKANIEPARPIQSYGVDSLSAVGFRIWFRNQLSADVSVFDILGNRSIAELAARWL